MRLASRAWIFLLLLALTCQLLEGAFHALEHAHGPVPAASGQLEVHGGDCAHGVAAVHADAGCLGCSSRTLNPAVLQTTLSVPLVEARGTALEGRPPTARPALPDGTLGARGPPAITV